MNLPHNNWDRLEGPTCCVAPVSDFEPGRGAQRSAPAPAQHGLPQQHEAPRNMAEEETPSTLLAEEHAFVCAGGDASPFRAAAHGDPEAAQWAAQQASAERARGAAASTRRLVVQLVQALHGALIERQPGGSGDPPRACVFTAAGAERAMLLRVLVDAAGAESEEQLAAGDPMSTTAMADAAAASASAAEGPAGRLKQHQQLPALAKRAAALLAYLCDKGVLDADTQEGLVSERELGQCRPGVCALHCEVRSDSAPRRCMWSKRPSHHTGCISCRTGVMKPSEEAAQLFACRANPFPAFISGRLVSHPLKGLPRARL